MLFEFKVAESFFDNLLAVVERAFNGKVENVGVGDCRHLQFLYQRDFLVRVKDEYIDVLFAAHTVNGGTACIPGRGGEDIHVFA